MHFLLHDIHRQKSPHGGAAEKSSDEGDDERTCEEAARNSAQGEKHEDRGGLPRPLPVQREEEVPECDHQATKSGCEDRKGRRQRWKFEKIKLE